MLTAAYAMLWCCSASCLFAFFGVIVGKEEENQGTAEEENIRKRESQD
jgi:hypothetical protein